jgi:hypothetical protein
LMMILTKMANNPLVSTFALKNFSYNNTK